MQICALKVFVTISTLDFIFEEYLCMLDIPTKLYHSIISHQNIGRNQDFSRGFCLGGGYFSKCLERKGFWEEFKFSDG